MSAPWLILLLVGLGFIAFGVAYVVWPRRMGALTDVVPVGGTARADFMATYGGFQIGFGVFLVACTRAEVWVEPGLWAATAALAGFSSMRGLGVILSHGHVRASIWLGLALELVGVALSAWGLGEVR
jgi:hypothetical protein